MTPEQLKKLRNKKPLKLFSSDTKLFTTIQINKKESFICWERWVSRDRINWINHNLYLSLHDVKIITNQHIKTK